jgi:topoisomerase IV subunit B
LCILYTMGGKGKKTAEPVVSPEKKTASISLKAARASDPAYKSPRKKLADYDESQVRHLDALEHIRLRSGMYIGRLGDGSNQNDGIYIMLKEIIDNAVDEFIVGFGKCIDIEIIDSCVKVRDFGRGIPLGKVIECVSEINTGAKYNDDVFQFSVGMNGVGTKAVNALSSFFRVVSMRDNHFTEAIFEQGKLKTHHTGVLKQKASDGTYFEFIPDQTIFGSYEFNTDFIEHRMWNYAYLNTGLTLHFNGKDFVSKNGLLDLLQSEIDTDSLYEVGSYAGDHLKFAFTHTNAYGENYFSFVNGQYTSDGGTHLAAFKEGVLKGVNDFFQTNYKSEDVRDGIIAAVLVKIKDPVFESQTKNKLGNTDIRSWIISETQSGLDEWLHHHPEAARKLQDKILANEKLRTELNSVKKEAKEAAKKISLKIPKLKDCRYHRDDGPDGEDSMIFVTEGDSATGSMIGSRDVSTQAIFSLRGKPENMYGRKQSDIYKNEELYNLMMALGIEQDISGLRYGKIIIATDADNDGFHIRNLVLTFFLGYFEELVTTGRVFILETPLFRVRNKKETAYCYSEAERDTAARKLGTGAEVTRFKGLGEISPGEFGQFIEPEKMHLTPVEVQTLKGVPPLLEFYMGKNTPERREFIVHHLKQDIDA